MFSKHEAAQLKQQFWTRFGQYMSPVPGAEGEKVNWVNYKTGVKDLFFKMQADTESAIISIVIAHTDLNRQAIVFNHFVKTKNLLHDALQEDWQWQLHTPDENNKTISRIYTMLTGVNILRTADWPAIISFFKPRIIALDVFWNDVRFGFEDL